MTNQYRALGRWGEVYGEDPFDADYSADEEQNLLRDGVLEIAPRQYRTVSGRYAVDGQAIAPDEIVELALPLEHETALLDGGHLARVRRDAIPTVDVEPEPDPKPARRRRTSTPVQE